MPPRAAGRSHDAPIYFFTLVGAYKYGWRTGLLTALASPLVNAALFGMPAVTALPAILVKSALLAGAAGYAARRFNRVSVALLAAVVLFYQIVGSAGEWALTAASRPPCRISGSGFPACYCRCSADTSL